MGGGIGMGNTCKPMAVSFQCMTKFTTNKKNKETKKKRRRGRDSIRWAKVEFKEISGMKRISCTVAVSEMEGPRCKN